MADYTRTDYMTLEERIDHTERMIAFWSHATDPLSRSTCGQYKRILEQLEKEDPLNFPKKSKEMVE
ncbi:MAG: hypothetical protein ACYTBJ_06110 [Planctomycetota bacterium]|jgi:hypothetical protein